MPETKKIKTFWKKPEGKTGIIFLVVLTALISIGIINIIPLLNVLPIAIASGLTALLLLFSVLDPKTRALMVYFYKSAMRRITSLFIEVDPIAIVKNYINDLQEKLQNMKKQSAKLRGQMHKLQELIHNNNKQIQTNLIEAKEARKEEAAAQMVLKTRKAGRLQESNMRLEELYQKMQTLYRVLSKMTTNAEILVEDVKDQVMLKEQERIAIHSSNSAMKSALSIIAGDPDKRVLFDEAMEAMTEDISNRVGEMERFMQVSANFMNSIDVQNGIFEEKGVQMLEKWEKEAASIMLGADKDSILFGEEPELLDLNQSRKEKIKDKETHTNHYDNFFDF